MHSTPYVSIIIATFNREKLLREAIHSVFAQTYQNFELIIIDDGSTDNTSSMIKEFTDSRLHYQHLPNQGRSKARNVGLSLAKGKYITFLDSDDLYHPEKLALQTAYLDAHPETGMIYTSAYCIDETGNLLKHQYEAIYSGNIYKSIAFFVPVTITLPTVMVRREVIDKAGNFDENMHRFEDTDLWRRISKVTRIDAINEYTCKLRTHSDNHLLAQNPKQLVKAIHYYAKKIIHEDKKLLTAFELHKGLGGLYHYYASAMLTVPGWEHFGKKLLNRAYHYWPLHKYPKIKLVARYWRYQCKKLFSRLGLHYLKAS